MFFLSKTLSENRIPENRIIACLLDEDNLSIINKFRTDVMNIDGLISAKRPLGKMMLMENKDRDMYLKDTHVYTWDIGGDDPLDYYGYILDKELIPTQEFWEDIEFYQKEKLMIGFPYTESFVSWHQGDMFGFEIRTRTEKFESEYCLEHKYLKETISS